MNGAEKFGFNEPQEEAEPMKELNVENRKNQIGKAMEIIKEKFEAGLEKVVDTLAENPYFSTQDERGF